MTKRVVITGMGAVTPIGNNITAFTAGLRAGASGAGPVTSFDHPSFPVKKVYEVKGFTSHIHGTHLLDPFIQYAVAASAEAIETAGLRPGEIDPYRIGISVSSSKGGVHTLDRFRERLAKHPSAILGARIYANTVPNFAAQWIARKWKLNGPAKCYVAACATGTVSIIEGARMIRDGMADYCIAGASDASIVPVLLAAYHNMKAMAREDLRPFDKRRDGFLIGEGAGIVVLETLESARSRGAKIYGEIAGYAYGNDCSDPIYFTESENALQRTFSSLLKSSGISVDEIDYINLHGTGTKLGDVYETSQIKKTLGKKAYSIAMSSTKSMTGHMLGASGAVEIIASLLAMEHGFVPPTAGLEHPDPECDLDYTPRKAVPKKIRTAVSLSMGFGGHVAALVLRKV